jgi:hypothetical protein
MLAVIKGHQAKSKTITGSCIIFSWISYVVRPINRNRFFLRPKSFLLEQPKFSVQVAEKPSLALATLPQVAVG